MKIYGLLASAVILMLLSILALPFLKPKYEAATVAISTAKENVFQVEVADTEIKRAVGLMNRTSLPERSGMLFVFGGGQAVSFWMKNTLIPLDMAFISGDKKIVNIKRNAQPCKTLDCETYKSEGRVEYVLEINGGLSDKLGIKEGDSVRVEL